MSEIRWRSRRGLLELDILLSGFLEKYEDSLDEAGRKAYLRLLEYPDVELWDIIAGRGKSKGVEETLLELIKTLDP